MDGLIVQVLPAADSDVEELADLTGGLRAELLDVDAASVAALTAEAAPQGAKGLGDLAGWLLVQFGTWTGCAPRWPPYTGGPRGPAGRWRSASAGTC